LSGLYPIVEKRKNFWYNKYTKIKKIYKEKTIMEKMTKAQMFDLIKTECADNAQIVEFCDAQIALLANKAEKAKAKAAEKRAAGDELYAAVVEVLGSEPMTCEAVLASIEGEDLSVAKIRARLTQAVKNGVANKAKVKVEGKDKTVYTLA
jgi:hypothetical protein